MDSLAAGRRAALSCAAQTRKTPTEDREALDFSSGYIFAFYFFSFLHLVSLLSVQVYNGLSIALLFISIAYRLASLSRRLHLRFGIRPRVSESPEARARHGILRSSPEGRCLLSPSQEAADSQGRPDKAGTAVAIAVRQCCRKWHNIFATIRIREQITRAQRQASRITLPQCRLFVQATVKHSV